MALRTQLATPRLGPVGQDREAAAPWAGRIRPGNHLELGTPGWGSTAGSAGWEGTLEEEGWQPEVTSSGRLPAAVEWHLKNNI